MKWGNIMDMEKVKSLIKQATEHLSEAELLEANGWTKEDVELLNYITHTDFEIKFKE